MQATGLPVQPTQCSTTCGNKGLCEALSRTDSSSSLQTTQMLGIFTLTAESLGPSKWTIGTVNKVILWLSQQWLKSNACSPK